MVVGIDTALKQSHNPVRRDFGGPDLFLNALEQRHTPLTISLEGFRLGIEESEAHAVEL